MPADTPIAVIVDFFQHPVDETLLEEFEKHVVVKDLETGAAVPFDVEREWPAGKPGTKDDSTRSTDGGCGASAVR